MNASSKKLPLIGFFPLFYNLAETGRAVLVAKRYIERGGEAVFFSHGGVYERLAEEIGCKVIRVDPVYTDEFIEHLWAHSRLEKIGSPFPPKVLKEHVEAEVEAFKESNVKMVVSTNNFPCVISTRVANIPLVSITPSLITHFKIFPDDLNFSIIKYFPDFVKLNLLNFFIGKYPLWAGPFKSLAKKYKIKNIVDDYSLTKGDYTLFTDFIQLIDISESDIPENEFYIGPIFLDELFDDKDDLKEKMILDHINKSNKSILFTLGSSGTKEFFLDIINYFNETDYNVVVIYSSILSEEELPTVNDNILLLKHVPSVEVINKNVDLAIIHGGQGTVYTAAYSGKPVIGFPMQFEQHRNLELLVHHKLALLGSRKYFDKNEFENQINTIFNNYEYYHSNAKKLADSLPLPKGDTNAAELIIKLLKKENLI